MAFYGLDLVQGNKVIVFCDELSDAAKNVEQLCASHTLNEVPLCTLDALDKTTFIQKSSIDVCVIILEKSSTLNAASLGSVISFLKPNGRLLIQALPETPFQAIKSLLTMSGFVQPEEVKTSEDKGYAGNGGLIIKAMKPSYEIGASVPIKLPQESSRKAWKLAVDDDDDDVIDSDSILDQDDLLKPDPLTLRTCGTTGKRKACKNCSCGLAEELEQEAAKSKDQVDPEGQKSACGNCYLGDAFRCASCPYAGMPAFKPGEKVKLSG